MSSRWCVVICKCNNKIPQCCRHSFKQLLAWLQIPLFVRGFESSEIFKLGGRSQTTLTRFCPYLPMWRKFFMFKGKNLHTVDISSTTYLPRLVSLWTPPYLFQKRCHPIVIVQQCRSLANVLLCPVFLVIKWLPAAPYPPRQLGYTGRRHITRLAALWAIYLSSMY